MRLYHYTWVQSTPGCGLRCPWGDLSCQPLFSTCLQLASGVHSPAARASLRSRRPSARQSSGRGQHRASVTFQRKRKDLRYNALCKLGEKTVSPLLVRALCDISFLLSCFVFIFALACVCVLTYVWKKEKHKEKNSQVLLSFTVISREKCCKHRFAHSLYIYIYLKSFYQVTNHIQYKIQIITELQHNPCWEKME